MANVKISQLTAKNAKVESTDRIPIADYNGSTYDSKYVTGAEINELSLDTTPQLGGNLDVNTHKITSASNGNIKIEPAGTGAVLIGGNDTQTTPVRFMELQSNGTNYVGLKAPNELTVATTYTLPTSDGTSGQVLQTNGSGTLSWATVPNYKKYVALISQSGTAAPTSGVLENTLSGTPTFTRISAGRYELTLTGEFSSAKTWVVGGSADINAGGGDFATLDIRRKDNNTIIFFTYDNFTPFDGMLVNTPIEIRVYP